MRIILLPLGVLGAWIVWVVLQGPDGLMATLITGTSFPDELLVRVTPIIAATATFAFGLKAALSGGPKKEE